VKKIFFDGTPESFLSKEGLYKIFSTARVSAGAHTHPRWWKAIGSFIWPITFARSEAPQHSQIVIGNSYCAWVYLLLPEGRITRGPRLPL